MQTKKPPHRPGRLAGYLNTNAIDSSTSPPDGALEHRIQFLYDELLAAQTPERRRSTWRALCGAIASRSPEHVARLERERGLR